MTGKHLTLEERLKQYPHLRERFEMILDMAESKGNGPDTADSVEERAINELRKLGEEIMKEWAKNKVDKEVAAYKEAHSQVHQHKKK